ncbi:MAG: TIGR02450 family Trp-rich protein [Bacteriovoracaceae bacterium]|nr:TIGR02450 family Trp-rich protein [Bacteriovoracaceae bacterium]
MNYKNLLNSKWTAVEPLNKEKHFLVIKLQKNPNDSQVIELVILEAILTKRKLQIKPRELENQNYWLEGWK